MRQKYKLGDIVKIGLGQGRITYGQLLKDASIRIFNIVSQSEVELIELENTEIIFHSGVFHTSIANGEWPVVGNIPLKGEEDSWAPPEYIQDIVDPEKFRIYHKGKMTSATKEQVAGLEKQVMRKPGELINVLNELLKKSTNKRLWFKR